MNDSATNDSATARFADQVVVSIAPHVLVRRLLDGLIVLADAEPVRITSPGDVLWRMVDEPCTVGDLVAVWSTLFDVTEEVARSHVVPALTAWYDGGAIMLPDEPGPDEPVAGRSS